MPEFFTLVSPDDARTRFLEHIKPLGDVEEVETSDALGRVTAEDITSPQVLPEFRRSTVDGYAVRASDTYGASESLPAYLKLVGEVPMGRSTDITLSTGELALVHTGGMIPEGASAVVMIENTQKTGDAEVEVRKPVAEGENVINVGEDIQPGDLILRAGHVIRAQDMGGLLAVGITGIRMARQPRVAIYASGDEVIPPAFATEPGQVRDINSYNVDTLVRQAGGIPMRLGILPDNFDEMLRQAQVAISEKHADMMVFSAGSSVSVRDVTADVFQRLGSPGVLVHGVATKPGKPTILAVGDGRPLMGLPGNPVSAFVQFMMLGMAVIYRMQGAEEPRHWPIRAKLTTNVASVAGREDWLPTKLIERDGELYADPIFFKSNLIFSLVQADGLLKIPLNKAGLEAGEIVEVRVL